MTSSRFRVRFAAIALTALLPLVAAGTASGPAAAATTPSIRLIAASADAEIHLFRRGNYEIHLPVFVAATGGAFELWATRPSYDDPVGLSQVIRDSAGDVVDNLPVAGVPEPDLNRGMPAFVNTSLTKLNGTPIKDASRTFCPNNYYQERIDDSGPDLSTYPSNCWASPFTRGGVWGIDEGWATAARTSVGPNLAVNEGSNYELTVSIAEPYRTALGIPAEDASVTVPATVVQGGGDDHHGQRQTAALTPSEPEATPTAAMPITVPPNSALPDIEALPAWGMNVQTRNSGRSFLNFGATAWNAGPGILMVEGFRDPQSTTMDAYQYFYEGGEVVGKVDAGELEYDDRDMHDHWHFRDFAAYSLLDENKVKVVDSGKEAFCLAPTDPIDLTVEGAEWRPWLTDLSTACGEQDSLWIREVLQTGWGDTYAQYRPGQSFEITDLPNGKYFVKVLANPGNVLLEGSTDNNVALRKIWLRGSGDERHVVVPAYGLVDSEGAGCGIFC